MPAYIAPGGKWYWLGSYTHAAFSPSPKYLSGISSLCEIHTIFNSVLYIRSVVGRFIQEHGWVFSRNVKMPLFCEPQLDCADDAEKCFCVLRFWFLSALLMPTPQPKTITVTMKMLFASCFKFTFSAFFSRSLNHFLFKILTDSKKRVLRVASPSITASQPKCYSTQY